MLKLGWLSPDGKLIECGSYEHISIAHDLVKQYKYATEILNRKPDDDVLVDNGWVHIGISSFDHKYVVWWNYRKLLSYEQKQYLEPYFENKDSVTDSCYMHWEEDNDFR